MTCSPEKLASNRRNALSSTGPKTAEGKAVSRANALKHGLSGEGVVFFTNQTEAINIRVSRLQAELQPATEMGSVLVHRIGVLSVRLDCCQERETEVVRDRVAQALRDFDDNRLDQADALFDQLPENPSSCLRKLERTEPGLRKLLQGWTNLKSHLLSGFWKPTHGHRLAHLKGFKPDDCFAVRLIDLSNAVQGRSDSESSRTQLTTLIDAEIASLNQRLATLDPTELAQARALVIAQAKLDAAPAVHQIQKYEASTERSLNRMMKEARLVESATTLADQAKTPRDRAQAANHPFATTSAKLGSFSQTVAPAPKPVTTPDKVVHPPTKKIEQKEFDAYFGRKSATIDDVLDEIRMNKGPAAALNPKR